MPDNCDFVVFGAAGDLVLRKLIPALYMVGWERRLPKYTRIIAVSRLEVDSDGYRALVRKALDEHIPPESQNIEAIERLLERLQHVSLAVEDTESWPALVGALKDRPDYDNTVRVYYVGLGAALLEPITRNLATNNLNDANSRIVLEKPIGHDLESSHALNDLVDESFDESQIFRIDHYLGKESVQNLLVTRFANTFLEPLWNSHWIDHVQITVAESRGVEDRGEYYNTAGALRDMVQNHLLQLLCLVAMEPPIEVGQEDVRDEKLKVLHALKPMTPYDVDHDTVRGRYGAGTVDGTLVPAYDDEVDDRTTLTETFVALKTYVQNWRWAGVPFYLRTGKRMDRRNSEIVIVFKAAPTDVFPHRDGTSAPNSLTIQVQPGEGMQLRLNAKEPGPGGYRIRPVTLDLSYATTWELRSPDAYERLLMDVIRGIPTLFMRRDEVEAAWAWCEPILQRWEQSAIPPKKYTAGTPGPTSSYTLIERDGRSWSDDDGLS